MLDNVTISDDETLTRVIDNAGAGAVYLTRLRLFGAGLRRDVAPDLDADHRRREFLEKGSDLERCLARKRRAGIRRNTRYHNRNAQCACRKHSAGKPIEYDPTKDLQLYAEPANTVQDKIARRICPDIAGGTNFWPPSYSRRTSMLYVPTHEGCGQVTPDATAHVKGKFFGGAIGDGGRVTGGLIALDPGSGEIKKRIDLPYPNSAGVLSTAGGVVVTALIDGTVLAYDDQTLDELWRINVGSGFNAPPMTYAVNGKQYIAIASGLCCAGPGAAPPRNTRGRVNRTPELRQQGNATVVWVFGL
jgi:hypothetical protein